MKANKDFRIGHDGRVRCTHCEKLVYTSLEESVAATGRIQNESAERRRMRTYKCPRIAGIYHHTSKRDWREDERQISIP